MLSLCGFSQTVEWSIPPGYDDIKPYSEGVYYCCNDSKWGLISSSGNVILSPQYDFITSMIDGYAIAGTKDGSKNRINCIIDNSYNVVNLRETYYLVNKYYTYFSANKLPVANKSGKQGFINTAGDLVIKCQFDNVHPFSGNYASVTKYPKAFYITDSYDYKPKQSVLPVEFNYGDLTFASTFYNGKAVVAYNDKTAVINTAGSKVGGYKGKINTSCYNKFDYTIKDCGSTPRENEFQPSTSSTISVFAENGLYGYRSINTVLVYPSLSRADNFFFDNYAIVAVNGRVGLIHLINDKISTYVAKANSSTPFTGALKADSKGGFDRYSIVSNLPSTNTATDYTVNIDNGNGTMQHATANLSNGMLRADFTPQPSSNSKDVVIIAEICNNGLVVDRYSNSFSVSRVSTSQTSVPSVQSTSPQGSIRIAGPTAQTKTANEKDQQVVSATITNATSNSVMLTATLTVPTKSASAKPVKKNFTIPVGGSCTISCTVTHVVKAETVAATLSLSNGKTSTKQVTLQPYY